MTTVVDGHPARERCRPRSPPQGPEALARLASTDQARLSQGAVADALGPECPAPRKLPLTPPRVWALAGGSRHEASP